MDLPYDDHLQRAQTELGDPDALFAVSPARLTAKLALGVSLLLAGVVGNYFWWFRGPGDFNHIVFHLLYLVPLSGGALLLHMHRNRGLYVLIYPTGLLRLRRGEVDSFPWPEVERVTLKTNSRAPAEFAYGDAGEILACWLPVDVPAFKLWDAGLTVARADGTEAHLGPVLTDYDRLAEQVQRRTFEALWPGLRARFLGGERLAFGPLDLDRAGLRHEGKLLPWRELKELGVSQGKLSAKQSGKWLPWALVDITDVPNPHLLFALADEARRRFCSSEKKPRARPVEQPE